MMKNIIIILVISNFYFNQSISQQNIVKAIRQEELSLRLNSVCYSIIKTQEHLLYSRREEKFNPFKDTIYDIGPKDLLMYRINITKLDFNKSELCFYIIQDQVLEDHSNFSNSNLPKLKFIYELGRYTIPVYCTNNQIDDSLISQLKGMRKSTLKDLYIYGKWEHLITSGARRESTLEYYFESNFNDQILTKIHFRNYKKYKKYYPRIKKRTSIWECIRERKYRSDM